MRELVIHCIAPKAGPLILCASSALQTKPRSLQAFHILSASTRFKVQGKTSMAFWLVCGQMELWYNPRDDPVIKPPRTSYGELIEALP